MNSAVNKGILLSVHPVYAAKILDGTKTIELRRTSFKYVKSGLRVYLYSTAPVKRIVGSVQLHSVYRIYLDARGALDFAWTHIAKDRAGISKAEYDAYYRGARHATMLELREPEVFEPALSLEDFGLTRPPQSFQYITRSRLHVGGGGAE